MSQGHDKDELEAIQIVIDRVSAYQDAAPQGTVANEVTKGLAEAGVDLGDDDIKRLAAAIEEMHGSVDVATVLG